MLSVEIATVVEKYMGDDVRKFLADHGLTTTDISTWVVHAAGPKVIDAVENALDLPDALDTHPKVLARQWKPVVCVRAGCASGHHGRPTTARAPSG